MEAEPASPPPPPRRRALPLDEELAAHRREVARLLGEREPPAEHGGDEVVGDALLVRIQETAVDFIHSFDSGG